VHFLFENIRIFAAVTDAVVKQIRDFDFDKLGSDDENIRALLSIESKVVRAILPVRARLLDKLGGKLPSATKSVNFVASQRVAPVAKSTEGRSLPHVPHSELILKFAKD
jgi:hypothetical protein